MSEEQSESPHITALVLTRNQGPDLRRCVTSLLQTNPEVRLEILVVDNGSLDDTAAVTAEFPSVDTLRLPKDFGATKALNIGLRTARGDYIFLIPPTYAVDPDTIPRLLARLQESNDTGAVCPSVQMWYPFPDADTLKESLKSGALTTGEQVPALADSVAVDYVPGAPVLLPRRLLTAMNNLDERFGDFWWDLEMFWQIRNSGKRILVFPRISAVGGPPPSEPLDALRSADWAGGAAGFIAKHSGFLAGLQFRLGAILHSVWQAITFRNAGFHWKRAMALVSGSKVDGNHS